MVPGIPGEIGASASEQQGAAVLDDMDHRRGSGSGSGGSKNGSTLTSANPAGEDEGDQAGEDDDNVARHMARGCGGLADTAYREGFLLAARKLWAWFEGSVTGNVLTALVMVWFVQASCAQMFSLYNVVPPGSAGGKSSGPDLPGAQLVPVHGLDDFIANFMDGSTPLWRKFDLKVRMGVEEADEWIQLLVPVALWGFAIVWTGACLLFLADQASCSMRGCMSCCCETNNGQCCAGSSGGWSRRDERSPGNEVTTGEEPVDTASTEHRTASGLLGDPSDSDVDNNSEA